MPVVRILNLLVTVYFLAFPGLLQAVEPGKETPANQPTAFFTRAELEKMPFQKLVPDPSQKPGKEKSPIEQVSVHLHLTKKTYFEGETIAVYLFCRNDSRKTLSLDPRLLSLDGPPSNPRVGQVRLIAQTTGKSILSERKEALHLRREQGWPAGGYHVTSAELPYLVGQDLGAEEYDLFWTCSGFRSRSVRFTIKERPGGRVALKLLHKGPPPIAAVEISSDKAKEEPKEPDYAWKKTTVDLLDADTIQSQLSFGLGEKFYPDLRNLPQTDDSLRLSVEWFSAKEGDRLKVTFTPHKQEAKILLPRRPHLFLIAESSERAAPHRAPLQRLPFAQRLPEFDPRLLAPKTLEVSLPKNWQKELPFRGKVRIAVVVSSEPLGLVGDERAILPEIPKDKAFTVWSGILSSSLREIKVPQGD